MDLTVRPMTGAERMYCYTQSQQIRGQTGNIGYLRADMDSDGNGFFFTWNTFCGDLRTQAFREEFNDVIRTLRSGDGPEAFLKNRTALTRYCFSGRGAEISDREFGVRADTEQYAYLMRLNPNRGEYNLYCYCYVRLRLDRHLWEAERGIRFIDSRYRELFRIPDGGRIRIISPDGESREETCRYIDPYHVEVGFGSANLFHICEFAERMEQSGSRAEPAGACLPPRERGVAR